MDMHVRAILFDVFGTVVDWRGSLIADLSAWGAERGLGDADWTGLVDAWRGDYPPSTKKGRGVCPREISRRISHLKPHKG